MDTLLSYFYSTIPQVLAGAIGLLGVFCLHKWKLIGDFLEGLTESMAFELEINKAYDEYKKSSPALKRDFNRCIRRLKIAAKQKNPYKMRRDLYETYEFILTIFPNSNMKEEIIEPFECQLKTRNLLIRDTKFSLIYTGFLIFICVFSIPYIRSILTVCPHSTITKYNCLAVILLVIIMILFLINLIIIVVIALRSLDTHHEMKTFRKIMS